MTAEELARIEGLLGDLDECHARVRAGTVHPNLLENEIDATGRHLLNAAPALIALARRALELESALEFLHDNGGIICRAVPVGKDPWPETYGIDPIHAARRQGWAPTAKGEAK